MSEFSGSWVALDKGILGENDGCTRGTDVRFVCLYERIEGNVRTFKMQVS